MSRLLVQKDGQSSSSALMEGSADVGRAEDLARRGHQYVAMPSSQLVEPQGYQYLSKNRDQLDNVDLLERSRLSQSGTRKYGFQQ